MSRHATGAGQRRGKKPSLPVKGRNVEGATYVIADDGRGNRVLRCKGCNAHVDPPLWWSHVCARPSQEGAP